MRKLRIATIIICVASLIGFYIKSKSFAESSDTPSIKDVVWIQKEVFYPANTGEIVQQGLRQWWMRANGEFKEIHTSIVNGKPRTFVTINTLRGRFVTKGDLNEFDGLFDTPMDKFRSPTFLKAHGEFVREEQILGYRAFVLKSNPWNDENTVERYCIPEISYIPIKTVITTREGKRVLEPISIEFSPVTDNDIALPSLPISTQVYENNIIEEESKGRKPKADAMRQKLAEFKRTQK